MRNSKNRLSELQNKLSKAQVLQTTATGALKGGGDPPRWIED